MDLKLDPRVPFCESTTMSSKVTATIESGLCIRDDVAVFKVEDHLFRINRVPLDKETEIIPPGKDPIKLTNIKLGDFEILLAFLNLGYTPQHFSSEAPPPRPPSPTLVFKSRYYVHDNLAVFKVEDHLFRIDRALLDKETERIPRGKDPIELINIKPGDFEIMLDFLNLGTRHNKKPLTAVNWASVITVCSVLGMQRVLILARKTLSDQHNIRWDVGRAGAGFDRATYGLYFLIQEKGTANYLTSGAFSLVEGSHLMNVTREQGSSGKTQIWFIDDSGALFHAASGLAVDIVDDVPILRRRRPVSDHPNPWSHPLPEFSFVNSQIHVKFLSDPSLPGCTDSLYPDGSWATNKFLLAAHIKKDYHMHSISDFSPWIPAAMVGSFEYRTPGAHNKDYGVLVERPEDVRSESTSWEIVPASRKDGAGSPAGFD